MYIEKLEIQGIKSFANKNVLVFPGMINKSKRGITAIVGPNGSGKSNIADAIRWVLGEQSMKTLRGKKSEDIIFSGSDKKGKLGMAEVSLFLNNEDRVGNSPSGLLDYSQIVITRRLYRNGESEYILNNNRVRLSDIQMLLAKAKFGQKTYSVIGQGMVEGFLNTSLAERKEFFDEATGVKQYQIKRDESLNKLKSSYENLTQAQMLLIEIEPRLKSLTRQVNKLQKREETEKELKELQVAYYKNIWTEINDKFSKYNNEFLEIEKIKIAKEKKLSSYSEELNKIESSGLDKRMAIQLQEEWNSLLLEKESVNKILTKLETQTEMRLESQGKFDVSFLLSKKQELEEESKKIDGETSSLEINLKFYLRSKEQLESEKKKMDGQIQAFREKAREFKKEIEVSPSVEIEERVNFIIKKIQAIENEGNIEIIKKAIWEIKKELEKLIKINSAGSAEKTDKKDQSWGEMAKEASEIIRQNENIILKIKELDLKISAANERVRLLKEQKQNLKNNYDNLDLKIRQNAVDFNVNETAKQEDELREKLKNVEKRILTFNEKSKNYSMQEEQQKSQIFSLQRKMQEVQTEINNLSSQLNEIKANLVRYETKLEDLEIEIREELGGLSPLKNADVKMASAEESERFKEKIKNLKHQLELIGSIDPETENEYKDVKEKYEYLGGQSKDLQEAIESLKKIIKELDIKIKEQFDKEFKMIATYFEKYFKILFNGGGAKIIKVMESPLEEKEEMSVEEGSEERKNESPFSDNVADLRKIKFLQKHNATGLAGIEIQATPPGKKIKSIAMLSGGERALTAIALICAIIHANPSPFVVLDEVDAALDEANSEKLAKILDELSHKTQFIVITHNRASMRKANILYGVTMGDDGVSKLLSIKLSEAATAIEK